MADKKISQLTSHTVPTGSDELVIVSGGETKKITQENLLSNSLFYTTNTPTELTVTEVLNTPSPVNSGSYPGNPSGSFLEINDQYTRVIFDSGTGSHSFTNDIVLYVGDNLPGNVGMCIIEYVGTGSNANGQFKPWFDGGGRELMQSNTDYRLTLMANTDADLLGNQNATFLPGGFTNGLHIVQTTMMYTKIGNNPSGSFYQLGSTSYLNE